MPKVIIEISDGVENGIPTVYVYAQAPDRELPEDIDEYSPAENIACVAIGAIYELLGLEEIPDVSNVIH